MQMLPDEPKTPQVASSPFTEPVTTIAQTKVHFAAAPLNSSFRVELIGRKLSTNNPHVGWWPYFTAVGAADPEVFHIGSHVYVTEGLIRGCQTDEQLAAVLAYELGRMISEREASVNAQIRNPDRLLPMQLPIGGNGNAHEADPTNFVEVAKFEKRYPKHSSRLLPPNPEQIARSILERGGYQRTELDAAMPILQNAARFSSVEHQFKGTLKQSDWQRPGGV